MWSSIVQRRINDGKRRIRSGKKAILAFVESNPKITTKELKALLDIGDTKAKELLHLYWDLAEQIVIKQREAAWGDGFLLQMSQDLKAESSDHQQESKPQELPAQRIETSY